MSEFFDPGERVAMHGRDLPHWQQGEVMQFVTFRLGDSLPQAQLAIWHSERSAWIDHHPEPWSDADRAEYQSRFTWRMESWLDAGTGSCLLQEPTNRTILKEAMMRYEGIRVAHVAWVIMPNHVHALFVPRSPVEKLVAAWKGVSARGIGRGSIWQSNFRDTLIRDASHFANAVRYIRRNPRALRPGTFTLWESPRAKAVPDQAVL